MSGLTLREIATLVSGEVVGGDPSIEITGIQSLDRAGPGELSFLANGRYSSWVAGTRATAVLVPSDYTAALPVAAIRVRNPDLAFARVAEALWRPGGAERSGHAGDPEVHFTAVLGKDVRLGRGLVVGPLVVLEDSVEIGDGTRIDAQCFVGARTRIGSRCRLYARVVVREDCTVGDRVILHSGAVIGSDGFGYATTEAGEHIKIPQLGTVVIEDDVEIGANTTVDRARFDRTVIRQGAKVDNLVMIAHNVEVGERSLLAAQAGVAGSTKLGANVVLGGQAGLAGHLVVGDGARVGGQAGVTKSVPPGLTVSGYPARPHAEALRDLALLRRLPELASRSGRRQRTRARPKKSRNEAKPADDPRHRRA